jgi:uncharacterized membrane protein YccC
MLPRLDRATLIFTFNCFAAAMLAMFIGFAVGLPRPYWAMTTAYIVSQPLSGAVRSKALFRVIGTLLGAAFAVLAVPMLVDAPVLLSLAMALWVGACLAISLLDRTPRSYVVMLAGYTAPIIGFSAVSQPQAIFDIAASRVTEIGLGILCATVLHSLVFPRSVGAALCVRLRHWLNEADHWALDILLARDGALIDGDRRKLALAAGETRILATHLPYDTSRLSETSAAVRALHARMMLLVPLLSGVSDRIAALGSAAPAEVVAVMADLAGWLGRGAAKDQAETLRRRLADMAARPLARDWTGLLVDSLLLRLGELVTTLGEAHALMAHLTDLDRPIDADLRAVIAGAGRERLHSDLPLAVLSGAAATIAVLVCCALWIECGWVEGAAAAALTAVFCSFFAALDDPVPAIVNFGVFLIVVSLPLAALYEFAVLPSIDGFPMLVAVMAPPLLLCGAYIPDPAKAGSALAMIVGFCSALALQESFSADFANFINVNLGQVVGLFAAIFATAALRSISAEASVRRMLGQTWRGVAQLARADHAPAPAEFAARLVDRLGLITPKLAEGSGGEATALGALRDLRVGMNLVTLLGARPALPSATRHAVEAVLAGVGDHYTALSAGRPEPGVTPLLHRIDAALAIALVEPERPHAAGMAGLVGLRRNLCPHAPGFGQPQTGGAP